MKTETIYSDYCAFCTLLNPEVELAPDSVKFYDCVSCYTSLRSDMERADIITKYRRR